MIVSGTDIKISGRFLRIARRHGDQYLFVDDPELLVSGLRAVKERIDLFTFVQRIADSDGSPKYKYDLEMDNFAAIPISTFDNWWTKQIDNKTRNMVRKSEKGGLELREVPFGPDLVRGIHAIYNETPVRQGKPFPHYGKDLESVHREEGTHLENSVFIGAFSGDSLVGFIKVVCDEKGAQAGLLNIVSMIQHRDKAPTNGLIARAVRYCAERQIPYLVYSHFLYGKKQQDSLADFKRNNGFLKYDVPRYYVPISVMGSAALSLGWHRRWFDHIPEPVVAKVLELRNNWYKRKMQVVTKSS
jgi:hypothetical protein